MKKLIIICLLLATTFTVNAQDGKPTKEQTLAYLDKTFKLSNSQTLIIKSWNYECITENNNFTVNEIKTGSRCTRDKNDEPTTTYQEYISKDLKWETVVSIEKLPKDEDRIDERVQLLITFQLNFIQTWQGQTESRNRLELSIVKTKEDSFKKALERLVEIAKEENKNPFEN